MVNHPKNRNDIAGAVLISVDEMIAEIRGKVFEEGLMINNAISENYPLLCTLQLFHVGYNRAILSREIVPLLVPQAGMDE